MGYRVALVGDSFLGFLHLLLNWFVHLLSCICPCHECWAVGILCLRMVMHGQNVQFGNLIPGNCCFRREIFAILRGNLSFRWICRGVFLQKYLKIVKTLTVLMTFLTSLGCCINRCKIYTMKFENTPFFELLISPLIIWPLPPVLFSLYPAMAWSMRSDLQESN